MASILVQVSQNSDDCMYQVNFGGSPRFDLAWTTPPAGSNGAASNKFGSGHRFATVNIPYLSTITFAKLIVTCNGAFSSGDAKCRIQAEKSGNPTTFTDMANFQSRVANMTTAYTSWTMPSMSNDTEYSSPDIKDVVQEVVNLGSYGYGHAMVFIWHDYAAESTDAAGCYRQGHAHESVPGDAMQLYVEFTPPSPLVISSTPASKLVSMGLVPAW